MIQEKSKNLEVELIGDQEGGIDSIQAEISKDEIAKLFDIVSSQIYKNPISSICREITSNCFDSHIEANVEDAVVIGFSEDEEGEFIYFQDVGIGMSPERFANVYMKYLKSTKDNTNGQIGYWGLGSKSPLSYTDHFYIITRHNGIEYTYMLHKGETVPTAEKLNEVSTTKRNGTIIKIHMLEWADKSKFIQALKEELVYFDNVYYDRTVGISNDYKVYEANTFKYNNKNQYAHELHICLGKVSYSIDWKEIGMRAIYLPVGIKFSIGDLRITPSRESIKYDDKTRANIKKGIEKCIIEVKKKFREQKEDAATIWNVIALQQTKKPLKLSEADGIDVSGVVDAEDLEYKHQFLKHLPIKPYMDNPFFFITIDKKLGDGGLRDARTRDSLTYLLVKLSRNELIIKIGKQYEKVKNLYLKDKYGLKGKHNNMFFVKEQHITYRDWKKLLQIPPGSIGVARAIMAYKSVLLGDLLVAGVKNYEDIVVDPEWLHTYRASLKQKKVSVTGNIEFKVALPFGREYEWRKKDMALQKLYDYTGFVIYGTRDQTDRLKQVERLIAERVPRDISRKNKHTAYPYQVIQVTIPNLQYLVDRPNMCNVYHISPKIRVFRDILTAYRIKRMNIQYSEAFAVFVKRFNYSVGYKMQCVIKFMEDNWKMNASHGELLEELYEVAEANNLWNNTILDYVIDVEDFFKKVPLLNGIAFRDEKIVTVDGVVDYLKKSKVKMNEEHYKSSLLDSADHELPEIKVIEMDTHDNLRITSNN